MESDILLKSYVNEAMPFEGDGINPFPDAIMVSATRSLQLSNIKKLIKQNYEEWSISLKNPSHMQQ